MSARDVNDVIYSTLRDRGLAADRAGQMTVVLQSALTAAGYVIERDWQTMETAPRDRISMLLTRASLVPVFGWWHRGQWRHGPKGTPIFPTHWRPLPTPPQEATDDAK